MKYFYQHKAYRTFRKEMTCTIKFCWLIFSTVLNALFLSLNVFRILIHLTTAQHQILDELCV